MKGVLQVRIEGFIRRYPVEQVFSTAQLEHFRIFGANGSILFQSNRPFLRSNGLKMRRIDWKLIDGNLRSLSAKEALIKSLDEYVRAEEKAGKL